MADDFSDDRTRHTSRRARTETDRALVTPEIETAFDVLSSHERRLVCNHVADREKEAFSLDTLATVLEAETDQARIELHHRHLPKLERAGLIEYDARSNTVRYHGQPSLEKWAEHAAYLEQNE
jgi:hypothetical protein